MPNLASLLKSEISRVARKQIRDEIEPLKKSLSSARSEIVSLKQQVKGLQAELKSVRRATRPQLAETSEAAASPQIRFRASTMKAHRQKVGLSAKDYGRLIGASELSVYKWEGGKAAPRPKTLPNIAAVLRLGKREASRKFKELATA